MCLCVCVSESVCNRLRMMVTCFLHWSGRWQVSNEANACCLCSIEGRCLAGVQLHNAKRMQLFVECLCVCVCARFLFHLSSFYSLHFARQCSDPPSPLFPLHSTDFLPKRIALWQSDFFRCINLSFSLSHTNTLHRVSFRSTAVVFLKLQLKQLRFLSFFLVGVCFTTNSHHHHHHHHHRCRHRHQHHPHRLK